MKLRTVALASGLMTGLLAASIVPGRIAGAVWTPPQQTGPVARLVSVHVFAVPAGFTADEEQPNATLQDRDPLRARAVSAASCSNPGAGTSAYNLSRTRVSAPTTAHFYPGRIPTGVTNPVGAFQAAFNTWKAADPRAPSINVVADGTTLRPTANHRYDLMFKRMGTSTLAITYTWHWSTGEYENDTAFNKQMPWFQAAGEGDGCYETVKRFDLQNTATHEFGHQYGLAHVSSTYNTMSAKAFLGETYKRSLASGDAAGINAVY